MALHAHHVEMARRLDSVDPRLKDEFLKLQEEHRRLTVQELPKKQADLHFFTERCQEMEQARRATRARASTRLGTFAAPCQLSLDSRCVHCSRLVAGQTRPGLKTRPLACGGRAC